MYKFLRKSELRYLLNDWEGQLNPPFEQAGANDNAKHIGAPAKKHAEGTTTEKKRAFRPMARPYAFALKTCVAG